MASKDVDTMIVVGYLFVYDSKWQDIPYWLQKHLTKKFADTGDFTTDEFEPEKIKERWTTLKNTKSPIYEKWSKKSKEDKEVRDYCFKWEMFV